jgi:hypothetical protein
VTLWQIPVASQPTLRGRLAMPCNGLSVDGYASEHKPGRWHR